MGCLSLPNISDPDVIDYQRAKGVPTFCTYLLLLQSDDDQQVF